MSEESFETSGGGEVNERENPMFAGALHDLDDQGRRLQGLPSHGVGMGSIEFQHMMHDHPDLVDFWESASRVLELSPVGDARFLALEQVFLAGTISQVEMQELKQEFFLPYLKKSNHSK